MRDELQTVLDAVQIEITRSYTDALTNGDKNGRFGITSKSAYWTAGTVCGD